MFSSVSWLLLLGAMISLTAVAREVYQRHLIPQAVQRFSFSAPDSAIARESSNLAEVTRQHIFGVVPPVKKPVVEKPKVVEAPKTRLKLSLTGVITANSADQSRAMIEIKRGETSVVTVGEDIGKTGAKLTAVYRTHILIEYRGKQEKLEIVRPDMKLTDLKSQSEKTISALNINVAEFEALAKVDPKDIDISKLLPVAPKKNVDTQANVDSQANVDTQKVSDKNALNEISLQQLQELENLDRMEEINELQRILDEGGLEQSEMDELQNELIMLRSQ